MSDELVLIRGERHLSLTAVARCYRVEVTILREAYDYGLLGEGAPVGDDVAIPLHRLDKVARIVHLHVTSGVNVAGIAMLVRRS